MSLTTFIETLKLNGWEDKDIIPFEEAMFYNETIFQEYNLIPNSFDGWMHVWAAWIEANRIHNIRMNN